MKASTKSFLAGVGTVLAIYPSTNYLSYIPKESASERIKGHWNKTGDQLRTAMKELENSHEYKSKVQAKITSRA